jgi:hypothetical protein
MHGVLLDCLHIIVITGHMFLVIIYLLLNQQLRKCYICRFNCFHCFSDFGHGHDVQTKQASICFFSLYLNFLKLKMHIYQFRKYLFVTLSFFFLGPHE